MIFLRKLIILLSFFVAMPGQADAAVTVSFYSHSLGSSFPHAFVVLGGKPDRGGAPVDVNFGFTAKSVTPAVLMGPVTGVIQATTPKYIKSSDLQFTVTISDQQYDQLLALVDKWRNLPQKSYDLNKRNCVHFVGNVAELLGLKVSYDKKLMKKPKTFLLTIIGLNPGLKPAA
jgi:hypothetical protein